MLRLQAAVRESASLLRFDVRSVRRLQLREARADRGSRRSLRARDGRARQDRLSGIAQAAARRRARHRHDALSGRRREPVTRRKRTFREFRERLQIHGLDLRHTPSVELFTQFLVERLPRLDYILNNACQTVRRPAGFFRAPARREAEPARVRFPRSGAACSRARRARPTLELPQEPVRARTRRAGAGQGEGLVHSAELSQRRYLDEDFEAARRCSRRIATTRICSRSTCARSTAGACACTRSRRPSCWKCSS